MRYYIELNKLFIQMYLKSHKVFILTCGFELNCRFKVIEKHRIATMLFS